MGTDPALAAIEACDRFAAYEYDVDRPDRVPPVSDTMLEQNTRPALNACRLAIDLNSDDRRMQFQFARAASQAGRDDEAYQAATRGAELGGAQAMVMVGLSYQLGVGAVQSYGRAVDLYLQAADAGASDGILQLGYLYDQGLGVAFDLDESGRWFTRAAEAGNAAAIAYRFEHGRGVEADTVEARYWYERAAVRGDSSQCRRSRECLSVAMAARPIWQKRSVGMRPRLNKGWGSRWRALAGSIRAAWVSSSTLRFHAVGTSAAPLPAISSRCSRPGGFTSRASASSRITRRPPTGTRSQRSPARCPTP